MTSGSAAALRMAVCVLSIFAWYSSASAAVWESREGQCEGSWTVDQERSGVWVGDVNYRGGDCVAASGQTLSFKVRAVTVGEDFFALLTGPQKCVVHGRIDGENVRGFELCLGTQSEFPFSLRFGRP
jgi:hypothetical protein